MSIIIRNITKTYGEQRALDNVSVSVAEGEVVGLLGPNGAGKSTLMKVVTGYVRPDSGSVSVCGHDVEAEPLAVRRLIGYLPEHNPLYLDMYVREYLAMVAGMYGVPNPTGKVEELVRMTGLAPEARKQIGALSKGYRQRVGIAQALIGDPKVVILDEPTTGLDPNQIVEVRELTRSLARERTVILSTHIMQEVEATCDHIIIIDHGQIRAQGSVEEVLSLAANGQVVDVEFASDVDAAILSQELGAKAVATGPRRFRLTAPAKAGDLRLAAFGFAASHGAPLLRLAAVEEGVEDVFHQLTRHEAEA